METGKVYRIVSDNKYGVYIGSTFSSLNRRLQKHHVNFNAWRDHHGSYCSSYILLQAGNCRIELISEHEGVTRAELREIEKRHVLGEESVINIRVPYLSPNTIFCDCGGKFHEGSRLAHFRTNKHMRFLDMVANHCD